MTTATEKAVERIDRYRQRDSDAVSLARLASLAVRIEPHLLRRLRQELLPELDVGTEADVWFGPLVESRGASAIVLDAHVADVLREDLASDRELLRQVHRITDETHRNAPPTVRLEEDLNARALLNEGDVTTTIDEALRPAIRAIYEGGERSREIAHWVRRAMPRLHRTVVRTQSALSLLLASDSLLGSRPLAKTPDSPIGADALAWILSPDQRVQRIHLGMELLQRGLRFVAPTGDSQTIELPQTHPALVELEWTRDRHRVKTLIEAEAGRTVDLEDDVFEVIVRTLAGDEYVLERQPTEFRSDVFISYAHLDDQPLVEGRGGWVANLHRAMETRLAQLRGKDVRVWRDPKLQGSDVFDESRVGALAQSAVFVAVVSPRYLASEWCRRELEEFLRASEATGGVRVGDRSRLFKLLKTPVPLERQPPALQAALGYEFFKVDPDSGRVRELDEIFGQDAQQSFWLKLDDLVHDIGDVLDLVSRQAGASPSPATHPTPDHARPVEPTQPRLVYLICDQRDVESVRPLADFLFKAGGEVVLPIFEGDESEVRQAHEENLRECDAALIYYGAANEVWVRRKIRELQKSPGFGRLKPWLATAVYIGPPATPQKAAFRTHQATVIQGAEHQTVSVESLRPFLDLWA